jgi:hypothetical protein
MTLSIDSTLRALLADERTRAVLAKHFPGRGDDPRLHEVMDYSLRSIASFPEAGITQEKLRTVDEELRASQA